MGRAEPLGGLRGVGLVPEDERLEALLAGGRTQGHLGRGLAAGRGALGAHEDTVRLHSLAAALSTVPDPRKRRGVRHGLVTLLSVAVCAVAAGARSFVAIAEWAADLPVEAATALGINVAPSESAVRRLVQRLDPDRFDTAISAWIQQMSGTLAPAGRRRVLAVDGKTLRGSRSSTGGARHLLAVIDHHARTVLRSSQKRVVGVLLGQDNGKTINVANSFGIPFEEDEKDSKTWFLDHNYIEGMYEMFKKVNGECLNFIRCPFHGCLV